MDSTVSSARSLNDVDSFEDIVADEDDAHSCGDGDHLNGRRGNLVQLDNGDYMDAEDLVKCLNEIDNEALPSGPSWRPIPDKPQLLRPPHCRREAVVCVVSLRTASTFCYAVISRLGRVGVYDAGLALLDSYTLELGYVHPHAKIGLGREGDVREPRQHTTWVSDAVFLPDAQMLIVAASDRSLTVLDASRLLQCRRCEVRSLPAAPRCLAYAPGDAVSDASGSASRRASRLFIGDDAGSVLTLTFLQPKRALLRPPDAENKSTSFFWSELRHQANWVTIQQDPKVHGDAVCRLWYDSHNDTLLSCSRDPGRTLVIRHLAGRRAPYVFSLPRGASCFVLDRPLQLLVTAGRDAVVRLWNPLVPSQPQASLHGHKHPVLDVAVVHQLVVSMDLRGTLKVWHPSQHSCLQTLALPFTCLRVPGRRIEHGARVLYPGPPMASTSRHDSEEHGDVLVAALCGELVTLRLTPSPHQAGSTPSDGSGAARTSPRNRPLGPPRREHSPAVPESWSPSLLSPTSSGHSSRSSPRGLRRGSLSRYNAEQKAARAEDAEADDAAEDADSVHSDVIPKSMSPLPESIEDWPLPDDRLFKEDEPQMHTGRPRAAPAAGPGASPPEPVSHRPVPDEQGLYPEEVASLRALGLRPLDLEAIGVSLASATAPGGGGPLSLLPVDSLAAVRQAHNAQKKSHKQMRTLAWHCAPHLALKLPEETPLHFSRPLPVSSRMRARGLDVSDPQRLMQAKLYRLGGAGGRGKASLGCSLGYSGLSSSGARAEASVAEAGPGSTSAASSARQSLGQSSQGERESAYT